MLKVNDLNFHNLKKRLEGEVDDGRPTHKKFLRWFLVYVLGLDEISADDAICDGKHDKGIDAILVDRDNEEIIFIQSKVKEKSTAKIGDKLIREFHGSYSHLNSSEAIEKFLEGSQNPEVTKLFEFNKISELIEYGFSLKSYFITNSELNEHGIEQSDLHSEMEVFDKNKIANLYLGSDEEAGMAGSFIFSYDSAPLEYSATSHVRQIVAMVKAVELVDIPGIDGNKLFDLNVRNPLGSTKVNRGIRESIKDKKEHRNFPLFHNGIVIVCNELEVDEEQNELKVKDIAVVNGAQSLKQLFLHSDFLTQDLRVLTRFINAGLKSDLAGKVTDRTNSQNGVKSRDKKSNDLVQKALTKDIAALNLGYEYEIRRGSEITGEVLSNQKAGQMMLAFDLEEPFATHLLNNIFENKYAEIFNRPIVDGARIVGIFELYKSVESACAKMENRALGSYAQTKYLLLNALRQIFDSEDSSLKIYKSLSEIVKTNKISNLRVIADELLGDLIIDLESVDAEIANLDNFKSDLKNGETCRKILAYLLKERKRLVFKKRANSLQSLIDEHLS